MENPFKFGTIVEAEYFTDRVKEVAKRTNRWILQRLASGKPLQSGEYRTSTIYSALKRLQKDGYVIYSDRYELEDPFFRQWIVKTQG